MVKFCVLATASGLEDLEGMFLFGTNVRFTLAVKNEPTDAATHFCLMIEAKHGIRDAAINAMNPKFQLSIYLEYTHTNMHVHHTHI